MIRTTIAFIAVFNFSTSILANPLHVAAGNGRVHQIQQLVLAGQNINELNISGEAPLHLAVANLNQQIAYQTVDTILGFNQAVIDITNSDGDTVLNLAIRYRNILIVRLLIQHANINTANNFGDTPLHTAAMLGLLDIVNLLLAAGADQDATNADGNTAFQVAQNAGQHHVVAAFYQQQLVNHFENAMPGAGHFGL